MDWCVLISHPYHSGEDNGYLSNLKLYLQQDTTYRIIGNWPRHTADTNKEMYLGDKFC